MAQVTLGRLEAEEGALPPVCLCCGKPAALYRVHRFGWQPFYSFLGLLLTIWPFLFLMLMTRRRMRVRAPWCLAHRRYGSLRRIALAGVLAILTAGLVVGTVWVAAITRGRMEGMQQLVASWIGGFLLLSVVLIARFKTVRPVEITAESITLTGVAEAFAAQLRLEKGQRSQPQPVRAAS
jgi:hypothetical protein